MADDLRGAISGFMKSSPGARVLEGIEKVGATAENLYERATGRKSVKARTRTPTDIELPPDKPSARRATKRKSPARGGRLMARR